MHFWMAKTRDATMLVLGIGADATLMFSICIGYS